ncbi:Uncharacterised protein [Vibrio cholerae]|nr:Uncharacterised protein [Vibrio cholerae]
MTSSRPWFRKKRAKNIRGKARISAREEDQIAAPMGRM